MGKQFERKSVPKNGNSCIICRYLCEHNRDSCYVCGIDYRTVYHVVKEAAGIRKKESKEGKFATSCASVSKGLQEMETMRPRPSEEHFEEYRRLRDRYAQKYGDEFPFGFRGESKKAEKDEPKNLNRAMDEVRNLKRARQKVPPQERIAGNNDKTDNRSLLVVLILAVDGHRGGRKWLLLEARKRAVEQAFSMLREH